MVCNGTKNASSSDYYIDVDAFKYGGGGATPTPTTTPTPTPVPGMTTVNDDSGSITYSGSWTDFNGTGRINGDEHHTNGTNNYAQFTFTGTEVRWVCTKFSNRGKADVYIDGAYQDTKDLYSSSVLYQQEIYTRTGLSSGSHTIKVVCNGTKNASSSDYYIDVDAFIYGGEGATPTPTPTPTPGGSSYTASTGYSTAHKAPYGTISNGTAVHTLI